MTAACCRFPGWLAVHGCHTELGAIMLFGAAGLILAEKVLFPDRMTRLDSLASRGKLGRADRDRRGDDALRRRHMEGGFRQLVQDTSWRFAIGGYRTDVAQLFHPRGETPMTVEASRNALASDFLEGRTAKRRSIAITAPEGVTLFFDLADPGERATAFAIRPVPLDRRDLPFLSDFWFSWCSALSN